MIEALRIEGYRSIRGLSLELAPVTVLLGGNAVGKSSVLRGLELLRAAADGTLSRLLAEEGGLASVPFSAAPWRDETERAVRARPRPGPLRIHLSCAFPDAAYSLALGAPRPTDAALPNDLVVKEETVRARPAPGGSWATMMKRKGPALTARGMDGRMAEPATDLLLAETALSVLRDPGAFPTLALIQARMLGWRFHAGFRTDRDSPLRRPGPVTCAPLLDPDGANWCAVLRKLAEVRGDMTEAAEAVAEDFPGGRIAFEGDAALLAAPEHPRPFAPPEMSDGTLRFLALVAALTSHRRPPLIALNEPEASLNARLIAPLARLIGHAAGEARGNGAQIVVATHSERLAGILDLDHAARVVRLDKVRGETVACDAA